MTASLRRTVALAVAAALAAPLLAVVPPATPAAAATGDAPEERVFTFTGAGFGHGLGMSQWGAQGLAGQGWSAARILAHYYRGTALSQVAEGHLRIRLTEQSDGEVVLDADGRLGVYQDRDGDGFEPGDTDLVAIAEPNETTAVRREGDGSYTVEFRSDTGTRTLATGRADPVAVDPRPTGATLRVHDRDGRFYRDGRVELLPTGDRSILAVLTELPMRSYLLGLSEVPSSWHRAALEAQAIAGRTYAVRKRLDRRGRVPFDLFDSVADQNFVGRVQKSRGDGPFFANWQAAVDANAGRVVTYQGSPITAFYASSSGGHTEHSENVWGGAALPYLRGAPDPGFGAEPASVRRWTVSLTAAELGDRLRASGRDVGVPLRVEMPPPWGVSGGPIHPSRGGGVVVVGTDRTVRMSGFDFRTAAGLRHYRMVQGFDAASPASGVGLFTAGLLTPTERLVAVGTDRGPAGRLRVFDEHGEQRLELAPYGGFRGGVRVAACDLLPASPGQELVTGAGPGGGPHVRVFDATGRSLASWYAYDPRFSGGIHVACGDVDGDGVGEVVTGADAGGGPHVQAFDVHGRRERSFLAYDPRFTGGVRVAVGQVRSGGPEEIVTGPGPGGGPHITAWNAGGGRVANWFAYDPAFRGGIYVAVADTDRDDVAEIVTGAGVGGGAHVTARRRDGSIVRSFHAFGPLAGQGVGVRVGRLGKDVVAAAGPGGWAVVQVTR